jgi:plasmid maintenance system killer protein
MLLVEHADPDLERTEKNASQDKSFDGGFEKGIAKRFRYTMQLIRTVNRKNQLFQFGGLRFEKIKSSQTEWSMRLNKKYRLVVEPSGEEPNEKIRILRIENHYDDN